MIDAGIVDIILRHELLPPAMPPCLLPMLAMLMLTLLICC